MFSRRTLSLLLSSSLIRTIRFSSTAIYSFGDNSNGALGHSSSPLLDAYEPTKLPSLPPTLSAVAAGHYHSLAVTNDGEVWAWGRNCEGQLGRGEESPRDTCSIPERVCGLSHVRVRSAFASGVVSAAVDDDGSLWVWGTSKRGQLGLGEGVTRAIKPTKVEALSDEEIVKVSFGWGHALALTKDGKLFGWGYSKDGRLGKMGEALCKSSDEALPSFDASVKNSTSLLEVVEKMVAQKIEDEKNMPIVWEPRIVKEFSCLKVSDVACGLDHSLILSCDGMLISCGDNTYGQLGRKTKGAEVLPIDIMNFRPLSISAGLGHSLAICQCLLMDSGENSTSVVSWGWNHSSQLGHQGAEGIPSVIECLEGENIISVSAGRVHSIALSSNGELWAWGSGKNGRLGLGSSENEAEPMLVEGLDGMRVRQAVAGFDHNLLLVVQ